MSSEIAPLLEAARRRLDAAARLVDASLARHRPFDPSRTYTPEELEPYDALCDRYMRAVEVAIRCLRTVERDRLALNSESYRDLLGNAAKWGLIGDVELWFRMRDLRNRIVHDYLPEKLAEIYILIVRDYAPELLRLREALKRAG
jgi:nucleotidyltransferase substrate binding protein (TIGR01987 family)